MSLDPVSDIKSRLSIEDVVAPYVQLKKAGRSFKGLCPFHHEKSPSFHVSPERQIAYCFGCHKGGDVFSFIQEIEGLDFKGALSFLADKTGVSLEPLSVGKNSLRLTKDRKEELFEVNGVVQKFYVDQLWSTPDGQKTLSYLEERGILPKTIQEFELGFAPDSFEATYRHVVQKNCSKLDLLELGLLMSKDISGEHVFDRFRARLMFPIHDTQGRLLGFGGRRLAEDDSAKYMNSPESALYHKSDVLYGLFQSKHAIRQENLAVLVEGYMDVIASHQSGVKHVVATSGTALTLNQLKLIKRYTSTIAFAFDTDLAGQEALYRAIQMAQSLEFSMRVVCIPEGKKDPDECIRNRPEDWLKAVQEAPAYWDYYLAFIVNRFDLFTMSGKKDAMQLIFALLIHVGALERDHVMQRLSLLFKIDPRFLYEEFNIFRTRQVRSLRSADGGSSIKPKTYTREEYFLGLLLEFSGQIQELFFTIPEDAFSASAKKIYKLMASQYNSIACIELSKIFGELDEEEVKWTELLMLFIEAKNAHLAEDTVHHEIEKAYEQVIKYYRSRRASDLMDQIRDAQRSQDRERENTLFQEYSRLVA